MMGGTSGGGWLPEMPLTISGTAEELLRKMEAIKEVCIRRNNDGWDLFQDDEEWEYVVRQDGRTCNVCLSFAGKTVGSQIPVLFGHYKTWGKAHVKPGTHADYPYLKWANDPDAYMGCRCNLYWYDYMYVLMKRLWQEFEEVSI